MEDKTRDTNAKIIWDYLLSKGISPAGAAGILGNLEAESGLRPNNLQDTGNRALHMTDDEYVNAVDNGTYTNFVYDGYGVFLAQWTFYTRKQALLNFVRERGASVGSLEVQLDFLMHELETMFSPLLAYLRYVTTVREASDAFLLQFERPLDQSNQMKEKRASLGQAYFDRFMKGSCEDGSHSSKPSAIVDYVCISPNRGNYINNVFVGYERTHVIDTVTIHCVVGQCAIEALGALFANPARKGSSNYGIGYDGRIGLFVEETHRSWCSSSAENDNRAITIEVASDTFEPYAVTDAAMNGLIKLLCDICRRHPMIGRLRWVGDKGLIGQVDMQNMTAHRWFAPTKCPGEYLFSRFGEIAKEVNRRLDIEQESASSPMETICPEFATPNHGVPPENDLNNKEEDDMTLEQFKDMYMKMRSELQDNDACDYSEAARKWAVQSGLIEGATKVGDPNYMWADVLNREQMITVLYRFAKMMGMAQ